MIGGQRDHIYNIILSVFLAVLLAMILNYLYGKVIISVYPEKKDDLKKYNYSLL